MSKKFAFRSLLLLGVSFLALASPTSCAIGKLGNDFRSGEGSFRWRRFERYCFDTQPCQRLRPIYSTDAAGNFSFSNIPLNPYHLAVTAKGFGAYAQDIDVRSSVPLAVSVDFDCSWHFRDGNRRRRRRLDRERFDVSHRRRSSAIRQTSAGKPIVVGKLARHAFNARSRRGFERPFPRTRRSCREFVFRGRPADHRSAKQSFFESNPARFDPVARSYLRRASSGIWRQDEPRH